MEITKLLEMNLVYYMLVLKECKISYTKEIANATSYQIMSLICDCR